jgi:hypothetical protein
LHKERRARRKREVARVHGRRPQAEQGLAGGVQDVGRVGAWREGAEGGG